MKFSTEAIEKVVSLLSGEMTEWMAAEPELNALTLENGLREAMMQIGAASMESALAAEEQQYPVPEVACDCGHHARYTRRRKVKTMSTFGWVRYRRAYYWCPHCHRGQSPLDRRLGLRPGQVSVALGSLLALEGIETSFENAARRIKELILIDVSENTVRATTQGFGELEEAQEQEWLAEGQDFDNLVERHRTVNDPPERLYGSVDGVFVLIGSEWSELKVGCWYDVEATGRKCVIPGETDSLHAKDIGYYCDLSTAERFRDLVWASGYHRDADRAQEIVFVADGAAWIWKLVDDLFPKAVQIVDWYHAAKYLDDIATAVFCDGEASKQEWLDITRQQLWDGCIDDVIESCCVWEKRSDAAAALHRAITYYTHNKHRMDYARLRQEGYQIGSGTVESACKQIATQRLKRSGARWGVDGARHTGKARAAYLSGRWSDLKSRSIALAQAA